MFANPLPRALVAVLVAVGMQICCCGAVWMGGLCESCQGEGRQDPAAVAGEGNGHDDAAGNAGGSVQAGRSSHHDDGSPCGGHSGRHGNKHDRKGDCTCSTQDPKTTPPAPSTVDLPTPVLLAVVPAWDMTPMPRPVSWALNAFDGAVFKPTTSLLRQHCALIV